MGMSHELAAAVQPPRRSDSVPALEISALRVRYSGVVAVADVSLQVWPGEVVAIIGPNGAGKTSLFDAISGARTADSGRVILAGKDVTTASATRRARLGIRRTFQRQQIFAGLSVEDNVLAACEWRGGGGGVVGDLLALPSRRQREARRRAEVDRHLAACGLADVRLRPAGVLPIGQARMVELARAMSGDPTVLLLDEPTSGLGESEVSLLEKQIEDAKRSRAFGVLLIEHDVQFVMRHADRVVVLVRGQVMAEGTAAEIKSDERVRDAYFA
jgi:branched-chain amino acid transport system ATP-binding protein